MKTVYFSPERALEEARRVGRLGQFGLSRHAIERMEERNVTRRDIGHALTRATAATEDGERWRLAGGSDLEGDPLTVVLVFVGGGFIVTVM